MIILSQDKKRFVIIGRGCNICAYQEKDEDGSRISNFTGDEGTETLLGIYDNIQQSKTVVRDIYDSIGNGDGKYEMPSRKIVRLRYSDVDDEGTDIESLNLSVRTYNCLRRAGINTVEGLLLRDGEDLMKIRNLGQKGLSEIMEVKEKLEKQEEES